jgi:hypothetical protein
MNQTVNPIDIKSLLCNRDPNEEPSHAMHDKRQAALFSLRRRVGYRRSEKLRQLGAQVRSTINVGLPPVVAEFDNVGRRDEISRKGNLFENSIPKGYFVEITYMHGIHKLRLGLNTVPSK